MAIRSFPSPWLDEELNMLRDASTRFFTERWQPRASGWRKAGMMERDSWREAGAQGLLCAAMPQAYGGGGGSFAHDAVIIEAAAYEGAGFVQLMEQLPQERLIIALQGIAAMERALAETLAYVKERHAFGQPIWNFQNTRFKLAEVQATVLATRAFVDANMVAHLKGELDAARAALAKAWVTERQCEVMDESLQLFGGYGYMMEYPIAELYVDARVQRIYGGTNEIMKELASRSM